MEIFGHFFDLMLLKSDLVVVCSNVERHKNVSELDECIRQREPEDVFLQSDKLAKLIIIIPATRVWTERTFSPLKRITNCLHDTQGQDSLSSLSRLNIHSPWLDGLMSKLTVFVDAVNIFATTSTGSNCITSHKVGLKL
jgi:hypothetical protein